MSLWQYFQGCFGGKPVDSFNKPEGPLRTSLHRDPKQKLGVFLCPDHRVVAREKARITRIFVSFMV
jgi:hypothetical protein